MDSAQDDPSLSDITFANRRGPVRILADNLAEPGQLWSILPILIEMFAVGASDQDRFLGDALEFIGVVVEPDTCRREIQIVVDAGVTGKESTRANTQVVQSVVDD